MDAKHMHMEIVNRREWNDATYERCVAALNRAGMLPGQPNDPGEACGYAAAVALGEIVKEWIWERARGEYHMSPGDVELTATLYSVFVGHIPDEALGDQFYTTTRERYRG